MKWDKLRKSFITGPAQSNTQSSPSHSAVAVIMITPSCSLEIMTKWLVSRTHQGLEGARRGVCSTPCLHTWLFLGFSGFEEPQGKCCCTLTWRHTSVSHLMERSSTAQTPWLSPSWVSSWDGREFWQSHCTVLEHLPCQALLSCDQEQCPDYSEVAAVFILEFTKATGMFCHDHKNLTKSV